MTKKKGRKEKEKTEKAMSRDNWFTEQFYIYKQCPTLQASVKRREGKDCGIQGLVLDFYKTERVMKFMLSERALTQEESFHVFEASFLNKGNFYQRNKNNFADISHIY